MAEGGREVSRDVAAVRTEELREKGRWGRCWTPLADEGAAADPLPPPQTASGSGGRLAVVPGSARRRREREKEGRKKQYSVNQWIVENY